MTALPTRPGGDLLSPSVDTDPASALPRPPMPGRAIVSSRPETPEPLKLFFSKDRMKTPASLATTILFTDTDGRARFREEALALTEGTPQAMLAPLRPSSGHQLRQSPVGFRSQFHCTGTKQWMFVLQGQIEIGLQDGSTRIFKAGDSLYSADTLPEGAVFDPALHGHWSRQVGDQPLVTLFVKD
jgi:hypothetical protein